MADLVDIAAGRIAPPFGVPANALVKLPAAPMRDHVGRYYIRLHVQDRPGVIADLTAILRDEKISIESMLQHGRAKGDEGVPVVLVSHEAREASMSHALSRIGRLRAVIESPRMIRIEAL